MAAGVWLDDSLLQCSTETYRNSCVLASQQQGERDALAAVRIIASSLSILGSASIILGVVVGRQVANPKIHPIFQLSFADLLLSLLFIVGGLLWIRDNHDRVGCLVVSLLTVIFECVSINLKLVYALSAHTLVMKKNPSHALYHIREQIWHPFKSITVYITAWLLPVIPLAITFGTLAAHTNIISGASDCSCWCLPELGNILPYAIPSDNATAQYVWHISQLVVSFSVLLFLNYTIVVTWLCVLYVRIIRRILLTSRKVDANKNLTTVSHALPKAKKRIMYFLTTFVVLGFLNLLLSMVAMIYEGLRLHQGPVISPSYHLHTGVGTEPAHECHVAILLIQSFTVPLQGFVTAAVYGLTKEGSPPSLSLISSKVVRGQDAELEVAGGQEDFTDDEDFYGTLDSEEELEQPTTDHEQSFGNDGGTNYQSTYQD